MLSYYIIFIISYYIIHIYKYIYICVFHASPTKAPDLQPLVQSVGGQPMSQPLSLIVPQKIGYWPSKSTIKSH